MCFFDADDWYLEGLEYQTRRTSLNVSSISFPSFPKLNVNFTIPIHKYLRDSGAQERIVHHMEALPTLAVKTVKGNHSPDYIKYLLGIVLGVMVVCLILYCYCGSRILQRMRRLGLSNQLGVVNPVIDPETVDSIELTPVAETTIAIQTDE
jgi:hypothetical protein